jgi:hypothetical protein
MKKHTIEVGKIYRSKTHKNTYILIQEVIKHMIGSTYHPNNIYYTVIYSYLDNLETKHVVFDKFIRRGWEVCNETI